MKLLLFLVCFYLSLTYFAYASAENDVRIGVLAFNGKSQAIERWKPTADYLTELIPQYRFQVVPLTHDEFNHAINKGQLDFVLTNPGHYVRLEVKFGVTRIATFKTRFNDEILTRFASVVFSRKDSGILNFEDLQGNTLGAVSRQAFGGFQLVQNELLENEIDVNASMELLWLGFPQTDIVQAVIDGRVDAGVVRTGILERMSKDGQIDLSKLHIVDQKQNPVFPLMRSTALYPEWPFARLPNTDENIAKALAVTLLQMPVDAEPAIGSGGAGWTIPLDYTLVHDLFRRLEIEPYQPVVMSWQNLWEAYRLGLMTLLLVLFAGLLTIFKILKMNQQLKSSKKSLSMHQGQLEQTISRRTQQLKESNQALQLDIESRIRSEQAMQDACDTLQSLSTISTRNDLDRYQRLQSMLDLSRQYLGLEVAAIFSFSENKFEPISVSPGNELITSPLSELSCGRAILERQMIIESNKEHWNTYMVCPLLIPLDITLLFEFAGSKHTDSTEDAPGVATAKLTSQIVQLITQWMSNEILIINVEVELQQKKKTLSHRFEALTPRENEVLKLVVSGESNKSIAKTLEINPKTVELHRANLLRKTHCKSSLQLVRLAIESGIIN